MIESYISAWKRPFDFKGKSNRKEYWSFNLINVFILLLFSNINNIPRSQKNFFY